MSEMSSESTPHYNASLVLLFIVIVFVVFVNT